MFVVYICILYTYINSSHALDVLVDPVVVRRLDLLLVGEGALPLPLREERLL